VSDARGFTHLISGQVHVRGYGGDDEEIARLARRAWGVVSRRQLLDLGLSARKIDGRLRLGRLRALFPGVYAAGHDALDPAGRLVAGLLYAAPAAAGFDSALWVHGLARWRRPIHVTAPAPHRPQHGLVIHRRRLPACEIVQVGGIPVVSVERTLLDVSGRVGPRALRRLVKDAEYRGLTSIGALDAVLARHPRLPGRRTLARIIETYGEVGPTASALEDSFAALCAARGLPLPETAVRVPVGAVTYELDCLWREHGVAVELDGRQAHARRTAFEDDRERDRRLLAAGIATIRITARQLEREGDAVERDLRATLGLPAPHGRRITHRMRG
jgi:hypothetical protein